MLRSHSDYWLLMKRCIFLDRDGVLNDVVMRGGKSFPPQSVEEYRFLPGVPEAIRTLKEAGFLIVVATNQPDVGKGIQSRAVVEAMHQIIFDQLKVDDIRCCYHTVQDNCTCRKPKPGMLFNAAHQWSIDLSRSYMIGDRWSDVEAGKSAGCKTFMIGPGYAGEQYIQADWNVASLLEASTIILKLGELH